MDKILFTDSNTGYIISFSGLIYKTSNGGLDWSSQKKIAYELYDIFMNNSNVTKSVNQLFLRINNGENLNSISILVSGIVQDLLLGISLCGICVLLFFTISLLKDIVLYKNENN